MARYESGYAVRQSPYHVRTRTSLVDEYIASLRHEERRADPEGETLTRALDRMDREGWRLVAAAGEALLFRARHG